MDPLVNLYGEVISSQGLVECRGCVYKSIRSPVGWAWSVHVSQFYYQS